MLIWETDGTKHISCHHYTATSTSCFCVSWGFLGLLELWTHAKVMDCPLLQGYTYSH